MKGTKRWIVIVVASMLVLLTLFGILLWKLGLFEFTGADASAKIIAATLALIGGLIGSVVTVAGIFLKHSLDQRNADLRDDAERRLKLEAAIQAVQLLSTSSGKDVPMTQRAGVLFTLAHLGLTDLALTMMNQMLSADRIDGNTASWIINNALESNNENMQRAGGKLLLENAEKLYAGGGTASFPACLDLAWNTQLPHDVRSCVAEALLRLIVSQPFTDWEVGELAGFVVTLISVWHDEPDHRLRNSVGLCLEKIIRTYPYRWALYPPAGPVMIDNIRAELAELGKHGYAEAYVAFSQLSQRLDEWVKSSPNISD